MPNVIKPSQYHQATPHTVIVREAKDTPGPENGVPCRTEPVQTVHEQESLILSEAFKKAKQIVDSANAYSTGEMQKLTAHMNQEFSQARKKGQQEGYAAGMENGFFAGKEQGFEAGFAEGKAEADAQGERLTNQIYQVIEELENAREKLLAQQRESLTKLAVSIAETILTTKLNQDASAVTSLIEHAIENHVNKEWIHIYVARDVYEQLKNPASNFMTRIQAISTGVRLFPNKDLEASDCIVELPDEVWDVSVSTQLSKIKAALNKS